MLLYAVSRYIIEMFRGDPRGSILIFSTSQFISVILAPLAVIMLIYLRRGEHRRETSPGRPRKSEAGIRSSTMSIRSLTVPRIVTGLRLDVFLVSMLADRSRSQIQRLIKEVRSVSPARVQKPISRSSQAEIVVEVPELIDAAPRPEALDLPILYQDADLMVVDKPAGMVVHPAAGHESGTMVNALLHHVGRSQRHRRRTPPGIVHRLDRGTSD